MRSFATNNRDLNGKSILVTGGTGSFGQRFVRHVLEHYEPRRLIVFSRDELKQFEMAQVYSESDYPCMRYFIGDVRDADRLRMAMRDVDYVVHAAAMKQVSIAEFNPFETIKTNVHGAENVVSAALAAGVKRVVALSTDKAANPINLYGASKLASDKIFIAANNLSGPMATRFAVVRYGNVVGSRGSVVPFFKRLVADGRTSLPVTDERMTRFWITLDQGVDFVLSSLERMIGGEVFVPKIPSMKIVDLAQAMLPDAQIDVVGIRPGEKLHEVMVPREDGRLTLEFDDYYVIEPAFQYWSRDDYQEKHGGTPVAHEFEYSSDRNDDWLTAEQLHQMIGD
jgi:UDP-N-acetylglucosamine 4,6-dehydratase/5-epimerase